MVTARGPSGSGSLLFSNPCISVMHWSDCNDKKKTRILQTVLVINIFSLLVHEEPQVPLAKALAFLTDMLQLLFQDQPWLAAMASVISQSGLEEGQAR
jgi:hypothetical protein